MAGKSDKYRNFFFVFGLIAITFMAYKIGFKDIYANPLKTGIWFFVIMGVWLIVYLLNSVSFGLIIKDGSYESKKIKISRIVKIVISGLGCSPFARHYLGNHCCFLFLQVLRCFSSLDSHRASPTPWYSGYC